MEQYLGAFANYEQDNWVELHPLAKFTYNNSIHASTRLTPFFANYGYHPDMQFKLPTEIAIGCSPSQRSADSFVEKLRETQDRLTENITTVQAHQTRYAGGKAQAFEVGDLVWLSAKNIRTTRPSKKLDYKRTGPYRVNEVINANAYRLDLPYAMRIHNVFHVSLLDRYSPPIEGQHPPEPEPTIIDDDESEEYEVERILDSKRRYRKLYYLVQWSGYNYLRTTWEPAQNLDNAHELIDEFHIAHPDRPR